MSRANAKDQLVEIAVLPLDDRVLDVNVPVAGWAPGGELAGLGEGGRAGGAEVRGGVHSGRYLA